MSTGPRVLAGRFEIIARLGSGSMGEVYRARDRVRDEDVALKILPALDGTALLRFKNEFHALHDVHHPNVVRVHELTEDRGTWFFTMQLVDGVDLSAWIDGDEARLRRALPQAARGLQALHRQGLVHRDVKPSNILVTPAGDAVVLDFGLVTAAWSPGEGAGTPAYMAPEQVDGHVSPATDWYAVGVMLFHALTRRLPFVGSASETMRAKTEHAAPRVQDLAPDAPTDLAALADLLLARDPHARPSGDAVLAALGLGAEPTQLARNIFVGRERELAELRDAVDRRMAGQPFAIAIIGDSGIGKTALLRTFAEDTEQSGRAWVLSGRCWERESVPYKGFDGIVDELVARLETEDWTPRHAGWSAILAQAFPVLRRLPAFADLVSYGDIAGHETVARLSIGVRWLLTEVAARHPLVVVIDDLQWADRDTLALLRALLEPPSPNVLVAFGTRTPVSLDARVPVRTIGLEPLSQHDTRTLVELVVRELGGTVDSDQIARETDGHPLFAAELARHTVATGESARITFEDTVLRTTARLGAQAKRIATLVSLAHSPVTVDAAVRASAEPPAEFFDAIAALRGAQILATSGVGAATRLEPFHDRIRNVLTSELAAAERETLHGRIAEALEATDNEDPAALALHWQQAGRPDTAAPHILRAAEQAEAAYAYHRAAHLYGWALELAPSTPGLRFRQAEALGQAGLGIAAADAFLACAREAAGVAAIDLKRRAMQQLLIMGHVERALGLFDELMRVLELPNPTKPGRLLFALLRKRAAVRWRKPVLPPMAPSGPDSMHTARLDVTWDGAVGLGFVDPMRAFYLHSVNLDLCFSAGDSRRLSRALLGEAPHVSAPGRPSRHLDAILELTEKAAARASFPALAPFSRGIVAFMFGHWRECHDKMALGERLLLQDRPRLVREGFGPAHLQDVARRLLLTALFYLGQFRALAARSRVLLQDAIERNDLTSATHQRTGVQAMLHLAFGDVEAATSDADEGFRPWRESRVGVPYFLDVQARIAIDIYTGNPQAAHRRVIDAWPLLRSAHMLRTQYVHITMLDSRGRAALAAAAAEAPAAKRRALLADAEHCAAKLAGSGAAWARPLADALRAGRATLRGDDPRGHLERAAAGFQEAEMMVHAASTRLVHAQLRGDAEDERVRRDALAGVGIVDVDRYATLLLPR